MVESSNESRRRKGRDLTGFLTVTILVQAVLTIWFAVRFGLNEPPASSGDEPSYDSIGWQISRGHGFREDFSDPNFRTPYERANEGSNDSLFADALNGTVTHRPPLFPAVIAATNVMAGRQYWLIRLFNVGCFAVAAGLLFVTLRRHAGTAVGLAGIGMFLVDVRTRLYARTILTEPLAVLLVSLFVVIAAGALASRYRWVVSVILLGLMYWVRSAFVLWLPGLILAALAGISVLPELEDQPKPGRWQTTRRILLIGAGSLLVFLPWMIRNMSVLQKPMPLGAQGMMELSAGFSDEAWENRGVWQNLAATGFFESVDQAGMSTLDRERIRAEYSQRKALEWIRQHPKETLILGVQKICQEYWPRSLTEKIPAILALIGLIATRRTGMTQTMLSVHIASMVSIAMTWSVEGRFVVPLLMTIHYWAGAGLWCVARRVLKVRPT